MPWQNIKLLQQSHCFRIKKQENIVFYRSFKKKNLQSDKNVVILLMLEFLIMKGTP